jgi:hypothetical protein
VSSGSPKVHTPPIVRHLIACNKADLSAETGLYALAELVVAAEAPPGFSPEIVYPRLTLVAVLVNGRGGHDLAIELVRLVRADEEESIRTSRSVRVELGDDPLAVLIHPFVLSNIRFPRSGDYEMRLRCGGEPIGAVRLDVR